jgi:cellulose synthase/poly-beta-1,6-N-acetylglucosamine synthase-like glycosyltransferase
VIEELFWFIYEFPSPARSFWTALVVGLILVFFLRKARRNWLRVPELPSKVGGEVDATVIVPARNEEAKIAQCVSSFPMARVIVVDDASEDQTAETARGAGAEVINAPPLARGAVGKPNACQAGANQAHSKWLLFVDADTWYRKDFLPSLIHYAEEHSLGTVSVFPRLVTGSFVERMLAPYAFALYFCGVNSRKVTATGSSEALANGQCMLFRRDVYEFVGGHGSVVRNVIEDVALAHRIERHRMRAAVLRSESMARVRMDADFRSIWRGFRKNAFRFLVIKPWTGFQVVCASIALSSVLPVLAYLLWEEQWWAAFSFALLPPYLLMPWYGRLRSALCALPGIYVFQCIAIDSLLATTMGRKTLWKGRPV